MALKFSSIQALGRALMLPIAMLPVAGLLLRFGQPDLLNIQAIADAGNAIFANLPLLFAIGVAVGFAKDNNGASGLAGAVGYLILVAMLKSINKDIDSGVLGGILIGSIAGVLYNKYKDIKLPEFLAFFGGKRFIPIATGISAVILGIAMGYVWPPIQNGLHSFSQWMAESGEVGMFIYGLFNRLLLVTGLHHVLNSLFWFQLGDFTNAQGVVVHGDIARFMAGDPTAGFFQAGFFPIMMFGLPAICLAMYTTAHSQNKKMVAGLLLSMALTSFLTGVTEPIEYSFVFLAPVLYVIHAVLTGISLAVMELLHVRLGFSFSAGAIDYVLFFKLAQNPLLMLPVGAVMFVLYYSLGRESEEEIAAAKVALISNDSVEMQYINALGGADNLINVDACTTRLRLVVRSSENINKPILKALGAKGFVTPAPDSVQVILGPQAEIIASKIRDTLNQLGRNLTIQSAEKTPLEVTKVAPASINVSAATEILSALGGKSNLKSINLVALTRAKIELKDEKTIDLAKLKAQGVIEVINLGSKTKQLYIGVAAENIVAGINQLMK
jgi:PTS system N-acetylglucosamine-specific IIC component